MSAVQPVLLKLLQIRCDAVRQLFTSRILVNQRHNHRRLFACERTRMLNRKAALHQFCLHRLLR